MGTACIIYGTLTNMAEALRERKEPVLQVVFYRTGAGNEPVRQWLKDLKREDRKAIGQDVKTAQYGWPLGMPLIRKLEPGLWEVRSHIAEGIARVLFTVEDGVMVLLHGFVKKSPKTPLGDLRTARQRRADLLEE
jgi:phage-related protein